MSEVSMFSIEQNNNYDNLSKAQLKEILDQRNIKYKSNSTLATLKELAINSEVQS